VTSLCSLDLTSAGVGLLTLRRPDKLNSLSIALVDELQGVVEGISGDGAVKALVITGEGRAFCAGADVSEFGLILGPTPSDAVDGVMRFHRLALALWQLPIPTVAAVNGLAVGGGSGLAMLCDLRVMSTDAYGKVNQLERGIVPDMGATHLFPKIVGLGRAMQAILLVERLSAQTCLDIGLAGFVAQPDDLMTSTLAIAEQLAALPSTAVSLVRDMVHAGLDGTLADALRREAVAQGVCAGEPDVAAAAARFRATESSG
jgi:enoyl-CoA hydratase/carnithine racemase